MSFNVSNEQINKILSVIKNKGNCATLTDIKRSIFEYNKAGGADILRQVLTYMVSKEILSVDIEQAANGKSVETYVYTDNSNNGNTGYTWNPDDIDMSFHWKIKQGKLILTPEVIGKFTDIGIALINKYDIDELSSFAFSLIDRFFYNSRNRCNAGFIPDEYDFIPDDSEYCDGGDYFDEYIPEEEIQAVLAQRIAEYSNGNSQNVVASSHSSIGRNNYAEPSQIDSLYWDNYSILPF